MDKHWQRDEIVLSCQAYANSTQDHRNDSDQDVISIFRDHMLRLVYVFPADYELCRYHHHGNYFYSYIFDDVSLNIQKFQNCCKLLKYPNLEVSQQMRISVWKLTYV